MNQNKMIVFIICFSFFSGLLGAYTKDVFWGGNTMSNKENTIVKTVKDTNITDLQNNITKIVKETSPSIVSIIIKKDLTLYRRDPFGFFQTPVGTTQQKVGGGTGFFITKDGKIITNKHVISDKDAEYTIITNKGKEYSASVLAVDPLTDLAIMQLDTSDSFAPLDFVKNGEDISAGQFAIAIGNALAEFQNSVSVGVVSGTNRSISSGREKLSGLIQTDTAINPGNSGGPLINLDKKVMGINTAILNGTEGLGFAIALSQEKVNYMLSSLEKFGEIKRPFIGINYIAINPALAKELGLSTDYGAYISEEKDSIVPGSSADKVGIESGDIILEVDGEKLDVQNDLTAQIQNKIPGDSLNLKVLKKDGNTKTISLILGSY